jgi:hypothetical protein
VILFSRNPQDISELLSKIRMESVLRIMSMFYQRLLPWNSYKSMLHLSLNRSLHRQLVSRIGDTRVYNSAARRIDPSQSDYQPGGVLTAITGTLTGRIVETYIDSWGRLTSVKLRGGRNEGVIFCVIFFSVYRVCQLAGTETGPTTAYRQQIGEMLEEELRDAELLAASGSTIPNSIRRRLDPRARLLSDLENLIAKARSEGYRPIVCMDSNEDWTSSSGKPLR